MIEDEHPLRSEFEFPLSPSHEDYGILEPLASAILKHAGGWESFARDFSLLIRRAVDEVIDTARTNRFTIAETEKTEKTYLGTKIEILFRSMLKLQKGLALDLCIDGAEVDVKNTMGNNWAIPEEAISRPCVLIRENETRAICSVGLIVAQARYLNPGMNKDRKRTISTAQMQNVWWICRELPYPANFWELLPVETREAIMSERAGARRLAVLFERVQDVPIARATVQGICQQDDPMKRVRRNGGARDYLGPKGIAILFSGNDRELIAALGIRPLGDREFISFTPKTEEQRRLLWDAGHID